MQFDTGLRLIRQSVAALAFVAAGTTGSTCIAAGTTVLFDQPSESGIANHIYVAHVFKGGMPHGSFGLIFEQPNPFTPSGNVVTNAWDAGSQTGFTPNSPASAQLAFRGNPGSSTAQMEGNTVGAYLNSKDLPTNRSHQLMMIAPQYRFPPGTEPVPFGSSGSVLNGEMDLQIPMAVGKDTYISADFLFLDAAGTRISFGFKAFQNGVPGTGVFGSLYDAPGNVYILNSPLAPGQQFVSLAPGSAKSGGATWSGFRHFQWSIDNAQFAAALKYLVAKYPEKIKSTNPSQYVFSEVHLNAEFQYSPAPAELGWSMRGMKVWITG